MQKLLSVRWIWFSLLLAVGIALSTLGVGAQEETRGYGVEPCTTALYDLYEIDPERDLSLNLIGCEMDEGGVFVLHQYSSYDGHFLICNQFAYIYAANWLADDHGLIELTPEQDGFQAFSEFMATNGCGTFFEDWSWSE